MIRTIAYVLLFFVAYVALDALDKWNEREYNAEQLQVIPCDTDSDCLEKNPHLSGY